MATERRIREAVATVQRGVSTAAAAPGRIAAWIRKDYPKDCPAHGHNYLLALCGMEYSAR